STSMGRRFSVRFNPFLNRLRFTMEFHNQGEKAANVLKPACWPLLAAISTHAAAVGGLADVTLYDRSDGRQLPVYWHEGRAYVGGKPGNEHAVRVRNRQRDDVLGVISVDGVNVITGETAMAAQSGYVLAPYRQ